MLHQILAIWNEVMLVVLAIGVMSFGLIWPGRRNGREEVCLTVFGLAALLVWNLHAGMSVGTAFGGAYYVGPVEVVFKSIFLLAALLTVLLSWPCATQRHEILPGRYFGEYLGLLLLSLAGMCFLVSGRELLLLYVSVELTTIPLILLVAFNRHELRSAEAGLKYVLFSALSSGLLLFGLSLVYGVAGTTYLAEIPAHLSMSPLLVVALTLVLAGVGFKVAAVPFHLWAPDVYEGAPIPVTLFLSVASKAAGFVLFYKLIAQVFTPLAESWLHIVMVMAVLTMTVGNLIALHQTNMKRFLAYSSIAQAGFILLGLTNSGELGLASVLYYLLVYVVSNVAAFGVVLIVAAATGKEDMRDYVGLSVTHPGVAAVMMLSLFSLAGIPPLAGFLAKFYLFAAVAEKGYYVLVAIAVVNATISLYYYLSVLRWMYLVKDESPTPGATFAGLTVSVPAKLALGIACAAMMLFGLLPQVLGWIEASAANGF